MNKCSHTRKILIILSVMMASYTTLLTIIHFSKKAAETHSAATEYDHIKKDATPLKNSQLQPE